MACLPQLEITLGGMGGAHYSAARSVNVAQELQWQGGAAKDRSQTVALYRVMEREALRVINERQADKG